MRRFFVRGGLGSLVLLSASAWSASCPVAVAKIGWEMLLGGRSAPFFVELNSSGVDELRVESLGFDTRARNELVYSGGEGYYWSEDRPEWPVEQGVTRPLPAGETASAFRFPAINWRDSHDALGKRQQALFVRVTARRQGQPCFAGTIAFYGLSRFY